MMLRYFPTSDIDQNLVNKGIFFLLVPTSDVLGFMIPKLHLAYNQNIFDRVNFLHKNSDKVLENKNFLEQKNIKSVKIDQFCILCVVLQQSSAKGLKSIPNIDCKGEGAERIK